MKVENIFNDDEISIIYDCIETYTHYKMYVLPPDVTQSLILSSLHKLENITPQTSFTKQEYSVLYFAVTFCYTNISSELLPSGIGRLEKKLYKLAS